MNLHGGPTSRLFARWSGAPWRVGFAHYRGASLYNILVPDARTILNQPSLHTAEHQAAAFFYLGLPRKEIPRAQIFSGAGAGRVVGGQTREPGHRLGTALRHCPSHRFVQDQGMGAGGIRADG